MARTRRCSATFSRTLALPLRRLGDDPELLERLAPLVDMIEISPDAIAGSDGKRARLRPEVMEEYASASSQMRFVAHGVGLSIGSFDHWNENYLRLLDELFARFDLA